MVPAESRYGEGRTGRGKSLSAPNSFHTIRIKCHVNVLFVQKKNKFSKTKGSENSCSKETGLTFYTLVSFPKLS